MRYLFIVALCLTVITFCECQRRASGRQRGGRGGRRQRNTCHLREIDFCIARLEKYSNNSVSSNLLATSDGLSEICSTSLEVSGCFEKFMTRCATPLQRELAELLIEQFSKSVDRFCQPGPERQAFLDNSPCISGQVLGKPAYQEQCVRPFLASVDRIVKLGSLDDRLDTVCCSYTRWESCLFDLTGRQCGNKGFDAINNFVKRAFGGVSNLVCTSELFPPESQRCLALYAPKGAKPRGKLSQNPITKYLAQYFGFLFT